MQKLILLLLFVPIVSCSSGDDDDDSNQVMTIQNSKFLKANKNTIWDNALEGYFYIEEFDISENCYGLLSSVNAEILIDTNDI